MKYRALVFDDETSVLETLYLALEMRGYEVFKFTEPLKFPMINMVECLGNEYSSCTDFIITYIDMPNMTGLELIDKLLKKNCKVKNIAIVSEALSDARIKNAEKLGCTVFPKPFKLDRLYAWLDKGEKNIMPGRELKNFDDI